jgi:hypothetical protein
MTSVDAEYHAIANSKAFALGIERPPDPGSEPPGVARIPRQSKHPARGALGELVGAPGTRHPKKLPGFSKSPFANGGIIKI